MNKTDLLKLAKEYSSADIEEPNDYAAIIRRTKYGATLYTVLCGLTKETPQRIDVSSLAKIINCGYQSLTNTLYYFKNCGLYRVVRQKNKYFYIILGTTKDVDEKLLELALKVINDGK